MALAGKDAGAQIVFVFCRWGKRRVLTCKRFVWICKRFVWMLAYSVRCQALGRRRLGARAIVSDAIIPLSVCACGLALSFQNGVHAQIVVPGSGQLMTVVGDDFEDRGWRYFPNYPKSSRNLDKQEHAPLGESENGRWLEGPHRGTPDVMQRVKCPPGGLPGSKYALLMQTRRPGAAGEYSHVPQQDDVMVKVKRRMGHPIPAEWSPSCVVRVFVPPFDEWEDRTGASFGFRTDCWGRKPDSEEAEQFWPGLFINFQSETHPRIARDSARMVIRSDARGRDLQGPDLQPGWWTMGLSVSPDGMCHFHARKGVGDLTEEDHLGSFFSYGYRVERMDLFFFNIVTMDDGRSQSTQWIVDDPQFYCSPPASYDQNRLAVFRESSSGKQNARIPSYPPRSHGKLRRLTDWLR